MTIRKGQVAKATWSQLQKIEEAIETRDISWIRLTWINEWLDGDEEWNDGIDDLIRFLHGYPERKK